MTKSAARSVKFNQGPDCELHTILQLGFENRESSIQILLPWRYFKVVEEIINKLVVETLLASYGFVL